MPNDEQRLEALRRIKRTVVEFEWDTSMPLSDLKDRTKAAVRQLEQVYQRLDDEKIRELKSLPIDELNQRLDKIVVAEDWRQEADAKEAIVLAIVRANQAIERNVVTDLTALDDNELEELIDNVVSEINFPGAKP